MSMREIRKTYGVPAKRGGRIEFSSVSDRFLRRGTITSARGAHLRVRWDGDKRTWPAPLHPTWRVRYLDQARQQ